jgi:hypothetical protein
VFRYLGTFKDLLTFIYTDQVPTDSELFNELVILAKQLGVQCLPTIKPLNIQSNTSPIQSNTSPIQSNTSPIQSNTSPIHLDTSVIQSDTSVIQSDTSIIQSDTSVIQSNTLVNHSDTSVIQSDTSTIQSNTLVIHSDTSVIHSDTSVTQPDTLAIQSDTSAIPSDSLAIQSDTSAIQSDTSAIQLDTSAIQLDISVIHPDLGIAKLPNEILLKIFSYVPTIDLIRNVSQVSQSFKQLSKDPLSHVALHLDDFELTATDFRNFKQFLKGKYSIQEVYLPFLDRFEFGTYLNQMILQQRCTRVIDCQSMDENGSQRVLKLLAQHPEKARQLKRFTFTCLTPDVIFVMPDFKNLTHLQVTELKSDSFDDLTRQAAVTLNKLECFSASSEDSEGLDHSEWFSSFLEANQHSLKVLDLPDYECRTTDFESITSVCAQLETLNLNCFNVDKEDLLKMVNFRKISDLKITVSLQCFCPELISVCWEKAPRNCELERIPDF